MTQLTKRQVLLALAALGAGTATRAIAQACAPALDLSGGKAIGEAWRADHPEADIAAIRDELLPQGFCDEAVAALRTRVAQDFRNGDIFVFRGWRMSETEARLFALLTA